MKKEIQPIILLLLLAGTELLIHINAKPLSEPIGNLWAGLFILLYPITIALWLGTYGFSLRESTGKATRTVAFMMWAVLLPTLVFIPPGEIHIWSVFEALAVVLAFGVSLAVSFGWRLIDEQSNYVIHTASRLSVIGQMVPLVAGQLLTVSVSGETVRFMDLVFSSPHDYWFVLLHISVSITLIVFFLSATTRKLLENVQRTNTGHILVEIIIVVNMLLGFIAVPYSWVSAMEVKTMSNKFDIAIGIVTILSGFGAGLPQLVAAHLIARRSLDSWTINGKPSEYQSVLDKHEELLSSIKKKDDSEEKEEH